MRLRAPPVPRARVLFAARPIVQQRLGADDVRGARNWIGIVGAVLSDLCLQAFGSERFFCLVFPALLGARWFRSRKVQSPVAKSLGGFWLLVFVPAFFALLPGHVRWMGVIPMEGLAGPDRRRLTDSLPESRRSLHCVRDRACGRTLLSTAFSFSSLQVWIPTRFAFVFALRDRWRDWREEHAKRRMQKELDKRRAAKPVVTTQLIPGRMLTPAPVSTGRDVRWTAGKMPERRGPGSTA